MSRAECKGIGVIGLGYVGLTTAVGLGLKGHRMVGIDTDTEKVESVNRGVSPIIEQGLSEALRKVQLRATCDYEELAGCDLTFICVGTRSYLDGAMNMDYLLESVRRLTGVLRQNGNEHLVVIRCTVAPGTTEEVIVPLLSEVSARVCLVPEFFREGMALYDFENPSRIVIGEMNGGDGDDLAALFGDFDCPIVRTDLKTAEVIKCASNAFLASRVSLINELGNICKLMGVDVYDVARGMGYDPRIGHKFLNAGIGFGGSCLPKDLRGLIATARAAGYEPRIFQEVSDLNEEQPLRLIRLLERHVSIEGKTIGVLGLAFKPGTDDVRGTRAVEVVEALLEKRAHVIAHDPQAMPEFSRLFPRIEYGSAQEALNSDAVLILTEWPEFEELDYTGRIVIDGRNIRKAREARVYEGICW